MKQPATDKLIRAALQQVAFEGWTARAFEAAEKAEGWGAGTYAVHFPGGMQEFIRAFQGWVDEGMRARLEADKDSSSAKVREKIFKAVMARIAVLTPYREAARRLMGRQLFPWNGPLGLTGIARAADAMWKAAGDRSTDYNYYTKRMLLSGVYAATLKFWFADESDGFAETQNFLKNRIEDVLKFGKIINGLKEKVTNKKAA